jgi:hypothetical protein
VPNPFYGIIPSTSSIGLATTTAGQLLRPYPQFTGVAPQFTAEAHSSYNALEVKYSKRYASGLQFLVAYTWSKMIDDYSSASCGCFGGIIAVPANTDNNNLALDRSLSMLNIAQHLVANYQYELPFGKGKRFLNQGGVLNALVGGWSVNGITTAQSGFPISITSNANTTGSDGGTQRPDTVLGQSIGSSGSVAQRLSGYFNLAAFENPPLYQFGTVGRMLPGIAGPSLFTWNLSFLKEIPIHESIRMELRGELFNAFNHVNFNNPSGVTYGLPAFGAITTAYDPRIIQVAVKVFF